MGKHSQVSADADRERGDGHSDMPHGWGSK